MLPKICLISKPFRQLGNVLNMKKYELGRRSMTLGSGAGKGGGAGGSIKEAGGGLGKYGTAQEEGYFMQKSREQLEKLKKKLKIEKKAENNKDEVPK